MSSTSLASPRVLRAFARFAAVLVLALVAGAAFAQTPPYFITANGATTFTVHEGQSVTPSVTVQDGNGIPLPNWQVDWTVNGGSIAATSFTNTSGVATNTYSNYTSGTYTISASTFDGFIIILGADGKPVQPAGTAGPVTFTVNVENVGLVVVDPPGGKDVILTNAVRALQVYWGSASLPKVGTTINWSITSEPSTGAGTVDPSAVTGASGLATVNFSGSVPGDYTIRAAEFGCTWCGPTFQDFIITVVDPTADVHAILSDAPDPVDPGSTISYSIGVGNNGPDAAASASWSLATPANTVFESFAPAAGWLCATPGAGATGTVTCSNGSLASGAADAFTVVVRVTGNPAPGTIINASVNATSATADPVANNNDAATDTAVGTVYAWTFDKSLIGTIDNDSSTTISVGDQLNYAVVATNTGNAPLTNVEVNDDLIGGPASCPTLAAGAQCGLFGSYIVTAADEQALQVVNTGNVTSTEIPGPQTDTETTAVVLIPAPSLDLQNVQSGWDDNDGTGDVSPGDLLTYTITATNTGNIPLSNVFLSDDKFTGTQSCASVPVGGTCELTGTDLMDANDVPQVDNTATATADELGAPMSVTTTTPVVFHAFPAMSATYVMTTFDDPDGNGQVTQGDTLHLVVTATNTGNSTLLNLQIEDPALTPTFEICSGVSPGGTCQLLATYVVTQGDAVFGQVDRTATVSSAELPSWGTVTFSIAATATPAVVIDNVLTGSFDQDGSGDVSVGDELYYDITATNTGSLTLTNVVVASDIYGGTQNCAAVAPNGSCVLNVIYVVNAADANATSVTNVGSVTSAELPSPTIDEEITAVAPAPPVLTIVSGDGSAGYGGQSATLVVSLLDSQGNPTLAGETITWSGANNSTSIVQADGTSSNIVNFNGTTGFGTVTAAYLPASLEVQFTVQSVSATLSVVSGNNQQGAPNTDLAQPLVVIANDDGNPAGAPIHWTVLSGDATVAPEFTTTDGDGLATAVVTLGPTLSTVQIQAQRTDAGETAVFIATAQPTGLVLVSGSDQSAPTGTALAADLVVRATLGGNPQAGVDLTWTTSSANASVVANNPTDAAGLGTAQVTCGAVPETFVVSAERTTDPTQVVGFTATCTLTRTLVIHDGNNQSGPPGAQLPLNLVVEAQDNGVGADGVTINFTVIGGSDAQVNCCGTTAGGGFAGTPLTLRTTPGPVQVRAERADDPSVFVVFDATAVARGLVYVSGDNQSALIGAPMTDLLVVQSQLGGAGEANVTIDWSSTGIDATLTPVDNPTDASGNGSAQLTCGATAETFNVVAARLDDPSLSVTFTATCTVTRTLVISSGNNQSGGPGATLPLNLVVEARNNGASADGVGINFTVIGGSDAQVGTTNATTAGGGFAGTTLTLRTSAGPVQVRAERVDDPSVFVVFDATAEARGLVSVSGDNQSAPVGTAMTDLLVVQAQLGGAAEPGVAIAWSSTGTDATLAPVVNPTGTGGNGSAQLTCGATAETFNVVAARVDDPSLTVGFTATCTVTRTLVIASGNNQFAMFGMFVPQDLVVEARNNGVGADGVVINFTVIGGSDASLVSNVATTAGGGFAGTQLRLRSSPGPVQVRAERADDPTVFVVFTATAVQPTLTIVSGNAQSGNPGQPGAAPLVVEMRDGTPANNPVVNQAIFWRNAGGDAQPTALASLTGIDGRATMTFTYGAAGDSQISADDLNLAAVVFNVHAVSRTLTAISGDGTTFTVGETPFHGLQVQSLVDGVPETTGDVTWAVTTGNASIAPTSPIEAGGFAYNMIQEVTAAGPIVITATHASDPNATATFNFTAVNLPTLSIVSGDNQSGLAGTDADAPLVVVIRDDSGNPVPGKVVNWSIIAGNGSVSTPTTVTNASGLAQVTLNYGPTPGPITVYVDSPSLFSVPFHAEALAPGIGIGSGNNQTAPVNTTLPLPLTVVVGEVVITALKGRAGADALNGVPVTFAVASGGGSVSATTVLTDTNGLASTQFTLGPVEGAQTVTATVAGGASVTFTATATIARTLTLASGDGQSAAPGAALPAPLVVHAQDDGVDASGIGITWSVVSGSATVTPSGATSPTGLASATVTLGATPGVLSIRAERADDPTAFVLFAASTARIQDIPGLTPEQRELAVVIDETCLTLAGMSSLTPPQQDFLARCQELTGGSILDPGAVQDALDALMPGAFLAFTEAAFNAAQAQFQNLKARIAALRSGTQGSSFQGLALNGPGGTVSLGSLGAALVQDAEEPTATPSGETGGDFQRWGFFASGTIGRGEAEAGSTRPAYDYDINGLTVGLDYRHSDTFIYGAALGYTRQDTELQGAPGQMDMSGWSVSGYATWYRDNSWYTDAVLTWGRNSFDLLRTITYTVPTPGGGSSTISQTARSQSDGDMLEGAFTFGRDFQAGGWSIGPYGRLLYTKLDFDRIVDEMDTGAGSGLGLAIDARSLTSVASEIGAKFTYAHSTDWGVVTPHFQVEWEHEFKDDPKALTARFLADPNGTPFSLSGEEIDTDYFRMSVGLSIIMQRGRSGFVLYERTLSRDGFDQENLGFGLRIEF